MNKFMGKWAIGYINQGLGRIIYGVVLKKTGETVIPDLTYDEAELIVRKWNSQFALLQACKNHKKVFIGSYGNTGWDANYKDMQKAIDKAEKKVKIR